MSRGAAVLDAVLGRVAAVFLRRAARAFGRRETARFADPALPVHVIDGDTVEHRGERLRLWGIDSPERDQSCGGRRCGMRAAAALRRLLRRNGLGRIRRLGVCKYGRTLAILYDRDGRSLNRQMVWLGHAWAFMDKGRYRDAERAARAARRGVHSHGCDLPWEWRARRRAA